MNNQKFTLKALRAIRGWTQVDAARRIGVTNCTISLWETGKSFPSIKHIEKICEVYGTHYDNIDFLPKVSL